MWQITVKNTKTGKTEVFENESKNAVYQKWSSLANKYPDPNIKVSKPKQI